jgi:hypothetical protein
VLHWRNLYAYPQQFGQCRSENLVVPGRCTLAQFFPRYLNALFCAMLTEKHTRERVCAVRAQVRLDFALFFSLRARAYKSQGRGVNFLRPIISHSLNPILSVLPRSRITSNEPPRFIAAAIFLQAREKERERGGLVNYN